MQSGMSLFIRLMKRLLLSALILSSCATPSKIHQRSVNRGYEHSTAIVTLKVSDTVRINGKDSIIMRNIEAVCPDYQAQPTRYETRWKYKIKVDSINVIKYQTKWRVKEVVKTKRIVDKVGLFQWIRIFIIGFFSAIVANFIFKIAKTFV